MRDRVAGIVARLRGPQEPPGDLDDRALRMGEVDAKALEAFLRPDPALVPAIRGRQAVAAAEPAVANPAVTVSPTTPVTAAEATIGADPRPTPSQTVAAPGTPAAGWAWAGTRPEPQSPGPPPAAAPTTVPVAPGDDAEVPSSVANAADDFFGGLVRRTRRSP